MTVITHPTKAADVAASPYHETEEMYFLFNVHQEADGTTHLSVDNESPIAVTKVALRDEIYAATGVMLPTREEFRGKKITAETRASFPNVDFDNLYTMATGPIPLVYTAGEAEPRILLLQNEMTKPVNPGRWNFPSRLVSATEPHITLQQCLLTEVGLIDDLASPTRVRSLPLLTSAFPAIAEEKLAAMTRDVVAQEGNVNRELAKRGLPEAALAHHNLTPEFVGRTDVTVPVVAKILGNVFNTQAHVVLDMKLNSANVHFPVVLARDFNGTAIDPDRHGKNAALVTFDEARTMDLIPAPRDFVDRHFTAV